MAYTDIDKPSDYFETKLWTGNSTDDTAITGLDFAPNWVWIKNRTDTNSHALFDTVRGATKYIESDTTDAEATGATFLKSFTSDGFVLGTGGRVNNSGNNYASWNWKAGTAFSNDASATGIGSIDSSGSVNQDAGFSIVSYTGTGANATVAHGLGSVPKMIHVKNRTTARGWISGHESIGWTKNLYLDGTNAEDTRSDTFNNTSPTSSVFSIGSSVGVNQNTDSMIAYCFAEKQGYSKFGSYTGNGNADGTFVYTGFKPAFMIMKASSTTGNWFIFDNKREGFNHQNDYLKTNLSDAEVANERVDLLSNGFKFRTTNSAWNGSGATYIYMAFAENPFVTSTGVPATAR